jgi:hypothetical protein
MAADTCGAKSGRLVCDRAPHVDGDHRGYDEERDAVLFWPTSAKRLAALGDAIAAALEELEPRERENAVARLRLAMCRPAADVPTASDVAAAAEGETIRRVADHWFTQGGAAQFGPLEHDGREPRNADELIAAILDAVRSRASRA